MDLNIRHNKADLALLLQPFDAFPFYSDYKALDKSTRSIRLLQMRLESSDDIHATILHTSLDNSAEYEALSYCWGPPDLPKTIYIDQEPVHIRSSLHSFLYALCQQEQSLPVWVDSICINQHDVPERNWQVSLMGDIYRTAVRVKSWIGSSDSYSDYAFAFANCHEHDEIVSLNDSSRMKQTALESIGIVLEKPYWRRLWIIQEMALARELWLVCGIRTVQWEIFSRVLENIRSFPGHATSSVKDLRDNLHNRVPLVSQIPSNSIDALQLRRNFSKSMHHHIIAEICDSKDNSVPSVDDLMVIPDASLLRQMSRFSSQASAEPKDKIYALLSVATDGGLLTVDYSKSLADVVMDAILASYHTYLSLLNSLEHEDESRTCCSEVDFHTQPIYSHPFFMFLGSTAECLANMGLDANCHEHLAAIADIKGCSGMRHVLWASGTTQFGSVVWYLDETSPALDVSSVELSAQSTSSDDVYCALVVLNEIQLCAQAYPLINGWCSVKDNDCQTSLHYSNLAILALVLSEVSTDGMVKTYEFLHERLRRGKRAPTLCKCEVSPEVNREAFVAYKKWSNVWNSRHPKYRPPASYNASFIR